MVYSSKFVMCVLHNGEVQKELANGVVKLPFGGEYTLRFRNKNNRRAVVKISIDGENVSGNGYIVNANDYVDIKRHHDKDAAFKFVSLESPDAVEFGKNGPNEDKQKGVIQAEFYLEKEKPVVPSVTEIHHHHYPRPPFQPVYPRRPWRNDYPYVNDVTVTCGGSMTRKSMDQSRVSGRGMSTGTQCSTGSVADGAPAINYDPDPRSVGLCGFGNTSHNSMEKLLSLDSSVLQDGCTVEGLQTGQSFREISIDIEDTCTVLKLFLQGFEPKVQTAQVAPPKKKSTRADELEAEVVRLREQLAQAEINKLKKQLENASLST